MGTQGYRLVPYFLWAVLVTVSAITVDTPTKKVEAARGKNATLLCTYQTIADKSGSIAGWKKFDTQDEVITYYLGSDSTYGDAYNGRVSFTGDPGANNVGITITQLTMQDNGTYQCEVIIPKDRKGTPTAKMDLIVLVAPTKPICGIEGSSEYGQDIKLKCNSVEGSPVPDYQWTSYSPQNMPRQLPLTSVRDGSDLTLKNISADTSGYYICVSKNKVGEESCNITVAVMPPSMNIGLYAGIIGGGVAAVIVIGIIVYCCCCRDSKDKEDYNMAYREEEEEEAEEDNPRQQNRQQMQRNQMEDYEKNDDDDDEGYQESKRGTGPPVPPANRKPHMITDSADA
ncbi:cell surface A33 antigen [Xenopus laevis]|uniref:Cell surface A33 antigen n=2 Tax=Xenopus laevis TaxID=8355 RepID=A0A1L8H5G4_XENLA|nr:cell surface A33 antigen [Xenopus laevis]OCT91347.1 hypothetical protein XELAEV_18014398mg [Xenopus laevis]